MIETRRGSLVVGFLLILVGAWYLAVQLVPGLHEWYSRFADWPLIIVTIGLLFIISAAVSGVPGLAVPGSILAGIGGILLYQNATDDWASWAFAWALIPGFVGVGTFIMHVLEGNFRKAVREGGGAVVTSLVLFTVFAAFLAPVVGSPLAESQLWQYWPVVLIVVGMWMLLRGLVRPRPPRPEIQQQ